ncbi:MAG: family 43 glycosylhydrolase [Gemmatimonadota bacterium]|nr:family 43 glycosylhydrolase [Gemmatimonadota bacterium]
MNSQQLHEAAHVATFLTMETRISFYSASNGAQPRLLSILTAIVVALAGCDSGNAGTGPAPETSEEWPTGPVPLVNFDASGSPLVHFDLDGNHVDAHGGELRKFGDTYYLYGETYGCGFEWRKHSPSPFCGFRVYTSKNLTDWKDEGLLFDVSAWEPWQARCNWWTYGCFRPHVAYNRATGKYVLWVNVYKHPVNYYVLESSSPIGPFIERGVPRLAFNYDAEPLLVNNGDHNLFVDDDGTGYVIYTEWAIGGGDLVVERLTPDYLNGTGEYARLEVRGRESPSLFKRDGRYYVTASSPPNAAYGTSATTYSMAPSPLGPWSRPQEISRTSCGGQPFHVSQLPTSTGGNLYLYQSDLWLNTDGVGAGDPNQAPAPQFWAPLSFDGQGNILPISCGASYGVDLQTALPPDTNRSLYRLQCDIGPGLIGTISREFQTTASKSGELRSVSIPIYQRGEPDAALAVEVRAAGGQLLKRQEIERNAGPWDVPPNISWSAEKLRVLIGAPVLAGQALDVRLSSSTRVGATASPSGMGCHGLP